MTSGGDSREGIANRSFPRRLRARGEEEETMIKLGKSVTVAVAVSALLAALYGCEKKEGPLEKAGKEVDNAAANVGQKIEKAGENIQDAAKGENKK